jgi:hypothetical protein
LRKRWEFYNLQVLFAGKTQRARTQTLRISIIGHFTPLSYTRLTVMGDVSYTSDRHSSSQASIYHQQNWQPVFRQINSNFRSPLKQRGLKTFGKQRYSLMRIKNSVSFFPINNLLTITNARKYLSTCCTCVHHFIFIKIICQYWIIS